MNKKILVIYFLLIAADLFTTFIATPDLKYESNYFIQCFNLSWFQIIIFAYLGSFTLYGVGFISEQKANNRLKSKWLYLVLPSFVFMHLFYSIYVVFNNVLGYGFLNSSSIFHRISIDYFSLVDIAGNGFYFLAIKALLFALSYWLLKNHKISLLKQIKLTE